MKKKYDKIKIFRTLEPHIPDRLLIWYFIDKEEFLTWVTEGAVHRTHKPNKEGIYTYYAYAGDILAIFKTKEADIL